MALNRAVSSWWAAAAVHRRATFPGVTRALAQELGDTQEASAVAQPSSLKPGQMAHTCSAGSASILGIPKIPPELFAAPFTPSPPLMKEKEEGRGAEMKAPG